MKKHFNEFNENVRSFLCEKFRLVRKEVVPFESYREYIASMMAHNEEVLETALEDMQKPEGCYLIMVTTRGESQDTKNSRFFIKQEWREGNNWRWDRDTATFAFASRYSAAEMAKIITEDSPRKVVKVSFERI